MKQVAHTQRILLNPANYTGLNNQKLEEAVRKHSCFNLKIPTLFPDLELKIEKHGIQNQQTRVVVIYFSKDLFVQDGKTYWASAHQPFVLLKGNHLRFLTPSSEIVEGMYEVNNFQDFQVGKIGFYCLEQLLSFDVTTFADEPTDNPVFLHL